MKETQRDAFKLIEYHSINFWIWLFIVVFLIFIIVWTIKATTRKSKVKKLEDLSQTQVMLLRRKEMLRKHEEQLEKRSPNDNNINDQPKLVVSPELLQKILSLNHITEGKTTEKEKIYFVNYPSSIIESTNSYPILRFPKIGTVVRSYRLGNTKRRGFKEESFQRSLEQHFGNEFSIIGDARINTGKDTRPFEPDIAVISKNETNMRIDIEIDEPYAGITRQPTHCKGDDYNRDIYFVDRGWIVIRFSEYQIHLQEIQCLRFIAEVIKSAIPEYVIPNQLLLHQPIQVEKLWDVVQAQKWEKVNFREQYLNHIFQTVKELQETTDRDFNEQEQTEEILVKPSFIGIVENKKSIAFNSKNKHLRDSRIKFYPEPHTYTIDNIPAPSASRIIANFFPEFEPSEAIFKMKNGAGWGSGHKYWGKSDEAIKEEWENNGVISARKGTFLHEQIENFYMGLEYENSDEFNLFKSFVDEHNHIRPYRSEWRIFDNQFHIAGTVDLICENDNGFEMYDWKRSKNIVNPLTGEAKKSNQWQRGVGFLSNIEDTSYNRYCLQQSLYKYILEKNYGIKISKMYLLVFYPSYERYFKLEVPYLKERVQSILSTL